VYISDETDNDQVWFRAREGDAIFGLGSPLDGRRGGRENQDGLIPYKTFEKGRFSTRSNKAARGSTKCELKSEPRNALSDGTTYSINGKGKGHGVFYRSQSKRVSSRADRG